MKFNVILAIDKKNGISKNGIIPWKLSKDLKYFQRITKHTETLDGKNAIIMGRKTCETLPNRFLPDRLNIVLTQNVTYKNENALISNSFDNALKLAKENNVDKIWIIGGSEIYNYAFKHYLIDKIYLTIINSDFNCDTFVELPKFNILKNNSLSMIDENTGETHEVINLVVSKVETAEHQYLNLLNDTLNNGEKRQTRNAITYSTFSKEIIFNIEKTFPLLTTKKMFWKGIVEELLFFIRGETNSKLLEEKGVNIWKGNTSKVFLDSMNFDYEEGEMGPMYGYQWRYFNKPYYAEEGGIDQLKDLINLIKKDPNSRRLLMTDFNPSQAELGVLYPCHSLILQFYVNKDKLSVKMYQRSADAFLGLPFNIASTSLLLSIIAKLCNLTPSNVTISLGDCHVYESHKEAVLKQLSRVQYNEPMLKIPDFKTLEEVENSSLEDYIISDYDHHTGIKADMIA